MHIATVDSVPIVEKRQTIIEHLSDLRGVLFRSVLVVSLLFMGCFYFSEQIIALLKDPVIRALPQGQKSLYFFSLTEQLFTTMKVSLVSALILSAPFILLQLGSFLLPALTPQEKALVFPFSFLALLVFFSGILLGYFFVLPYIFGFLVHFNSTHPEQLLLRLADYLVLTLQLLLGTALILEFPVVLLLLGKLGIVTAAFLRHLRPKAYIGLSVLAAFLTPTPDAFSMILALIPLIILYEVSIWVIDLVDKKKETS